MARQTFWLLPEVVSPTTTSPALPRASIWRANIASYPVVIADGGKNGSVGGKGDRRPAASFAAEASDDLGGKMLRIGGTTAVAAPENLVSSAEGRGSCDPRSAQTIPVDVRVALLPSCGPEWLAGKDSEALLERALHLVSKAYAVILSDYAKGTLSPALCQGVIEVARGSGIPVLVDPKEKSFGKYAGATTICPNLSELSLATGIDCTNLDELIAAGQRLVGEARIDFLTVTMSEKGILLLFPDSSVHSPARAREVFDVSGAGDTVIATMAVCLASGLDAESAVNLSNLAAGIVVGKTGTAPISRNELVAELTISTTITSHEKVLDNEQLLVRIAEWRATGHRIVFTNGCFDILHVGHITLLEQCRRYGDKLIVAINSDPSVQSRKGSTRPVVGESERARVLAALASTDAVTIFSEQTPLNLIRRIRPDVLVKGGDYTTTTVVGAEDVISWGGRVEIVATVPGYSTSNTIAHMTTPAWA